jgi:hypothetical protein
MVFGKEEFYCYSSIVLPTAELKPVDGDVEIYAYT